MSIKSYICSCCSCSYCCCSSAEPSVFSASDFRSFLTNSEDLRKSSDLLPNSIDFKQIHRLSGSWQKDWLTNLKKLGRQLACQEGGEWSGTSLSSEGGGATLVRDNISMLHARVPNPPPSDVDGDVDNDGNTQHSTQQLLWQTWENINLNKQEHPVTSFIPWQLAHMRLQSVKISAKILS